MKMTMTVWYVAMTITCAMMHVTVFWWVKYKFHIIHLSAHNFLCCFLTSGQLHLSLTWMNFHDMLTTACIFVLLSYVHPVIFTYTYLYV